MSESSQIPTAPVRTMISPGRYVQGKGAISRPRRGGGGRQTSGATSWGWSVAGCALGGGPGWVPMSHKNGKNPTKKKGRGPGREGGPRPFFFQKKDGVRDGFRDGVRMFWTDVEKKIRISPEKKDGVRDGSVTGLEKW